MECTVRDIPIHYEEAGTGRSLLILHGWPLNGRQTMGDFEPSFQTRPGWRRLYPDLPGHGRTPVPESLKNHDDVVDIVLEFMDEVAPGERFVVAGVSWGGYIARGVVHHRLKQVDGVMLLIPVIDWGGNEHDFPAKQVIRQDPEFAAALQPGEEWMLDITVAQSRPLLDNIRSNFTAYKISQDPVVPALLGNKPFSFDPDVLPEPCSAPALFLTGRQDHWVGYKGAWSILDNFPRATFAVLDRGGHMLGYEQHPLALALMSEWLDRVEEYIAQNTP